MAEDHRGPGGTGDHRIEKRDHAVLAIENGQLHGQRIGDAHLDAGGNILGEALAMLVVEGSGLQQEAAGNSGRAGLFDQLFVQGIDGVGRARKLQVLLFDFRQHAAVFGGGLRRFGHDAQKVQGAAAALSFRVDRLQVVDEAGSGADIVGQFLFQYEALAAQVAGPVSYTHLDVYKRQTYDLYSILL